MNFLEEKILTTGVIKEGNILKVDSFLNHQIDIDIMRQMAYEFKRRFRGVEVNKVLTIEASGIAIATLLGDLYDVPVVFAKKSQTANSTDDKYISHAYSFTHKKLNDVFISKPYLHATDKVLIVDDFLADGEAAHALIDLVKQAGGEIAGIGIAIEKGQQKGGAMLRKEGYQVESIAIIESMDWQTRPSISAVRKRSRCCPRTFKQSDAIWLLFMNSTAACPYSRPFLSDCSTSWRCLSPISPRSSSWPMWLV